MCARTWRGLKARATVSRSLKNGAAEWLVETLAPAREAFASPEKQAADRGAG